MAHLVLSTVGEDREGLVSALSRTVETHGGNWLDSQFAHLAGKFAGIVLVDLADANVAAFEKAAASLVDEVGLKVEVTTAAGVQAEAGNQVRLHLVGADRPGMVRQISTALAERHVSISGFRSWTQSTPQGGGDLFEAEAELILPAGLDGEAVRRALEPIADELMVDLDLDVVADES